MPVERNSSPEGFRRRYETEKPEAAPARRLEAVPGERAAKGSRNGKASWRLTQTDLAAAAWRGTSSRSLDPTFPAGHGLAVRPGSAGT